MLEVINRRIGAYIIYNGVIHEFRAGRGTGTASIEAKLPQQLEAMREEVLYEVLLDLRKAYANLELEWCI